MYYAAVALALILPFFTLASPLPWDGAPSYSGSSGNVNGGSTTGGGGIDLIKILTHNAGSAGATNSGDSQGGKGGNRITHRIPAGSGSGHRARASNAGGSAGGAGYTGSSGTATGGNAETDPELTLLSLLSDNAADGGWSGSGTALGGAAGNIM